MMWSRYRALPHLAVAAAGIALGCAGPMLIGFDGVAFQVVHLIASSGWAWAALAFCVGLAQKTRAKAALWAPGSLIIGVVVYYLVKLLQGGYRTMDRLADPMGSNLFISWPEFFARIILWSGVAIIVGPVLGIAGFYSRRRKPRHLPAQMTVPVVAILELSQRLRYPVLLQSPVITPTWTVALVIAIGAVVVLAGNAVRQWRSSRETTTPRRTNSAGPREAVSATLLLKSDQEPGAQCGGAPG